MKIIPPNSTIGILGGGQLGRMTAMAAAKLGYHTHIFCSSNDEPAVEVASDCTIAAFDDEAALAAFAKSVDVVTLEWENVPTAAMDVVAKHASMHPASSVLRVAQDRLQEKAFARSIGIGTADYQAIASAAELNMAIQKLHGQAILKTTRMGYDGKGQVKVTPESKADDLWSALGGAPSILEVFVDFIGEISVIVARRADGAAVTYPPVTNIHRNHILAETHAPAALDPAIIHEAEHMARLMAEKLNVIGLLAVEMFVLRQPNANGQRVLMNEIAPRPHNSGHWTMDACGCSQFENLVRAICGLPLGSTTPHSRAVMHNLIGDESADWQKWLAMDCASLHLYGKAEARAGRKMGHVTLLKGTW